MYTKPMIFPLDVNGTIYAIEDEKGRTIGTGSREVCDLLLHLITKPVADLRPFSSQNGRSSTQRANVRSAIPI